MTVRTTVAFDPASAARLERLAKRWDVSKSKALRRALEEAEKSTSAHDGAHKGNAGPLTDDQIARMTPQEAMDWLQEHPQVPPGWGDAYQAELKAIRERDVEIEAERERFLQPSAAKVSGDHA